MSDDDLAALWERALGDRWPLPSEVLTRVFARSERRTEVRDGRTVGVARFQADGATGFLQALVVDPGWQRQGIGTALHDSVLAELTVRGVTRVVLGQGTPRLWQGIPDDLGDARAFFTARGWRITETSHDLVRRLSGAEPTRDGSVWLSERGFSLDTPLDPHGVLAFIDRVFPPWSAAYRAVIAAGRSGDVRCVCRRSDGRVVGALFLIGPFCGEFQPFTALLGDDLAALACVGVDPKFQGRGIGTALVSAATADALRRGAGAVHIGWTWRPDFYARIGYRPWRTFSLAERAL